jgi:Fe-S cluster biogenesis protein NfuA
MMENNHKPAEQPDQALAEEYNPGADPELRRKVEEALDMIRPYLMADGGSVRVMNITPDMVVELELLGACGSCPMSTMTLRAGIEQALRRSIPQIARVEAVNAPAPY